MKGRRESNFAYNLMVLTYKIQDLLFKPDNILDEFGIEKGFTVVDFGCGPGRYIKQASMLVGETGKVFAIDINEIAIKHVEKCIAKFNLHNVIPVLYKDNCSEIASESVDVVYALDMFHQVDNPKEFLGQLYGIIKNNGWFILEDGHQSREVTRSKVRQSDLWIIDTENERYLKLLPVNR
ncbi:MAG: methyltransferase domain-containing protein [Firmicutes bacterium]|nr:methyltransferase domain-containing protein [Bacillota bacterium]